MEKIEKEKNIKTEKLWFKRKLYGWGWTPNTWQGWAVTAVYLILIFLLSFALDKNVGRKEVFLIFVLPTIVLTFAFIKIVYKKGESPKWQWGKRNQDE